MKTPEEYFNEILEDSPYNGGFSLTKEFIIKTIKQVQIDSYNQALQDATKSARAYATVEDTDCPVYLSSYDLHVSKDSILDLKHY